MTLGGGEWVGGGVAIMMLHVWQNDAFPKFGISFLTELPFLFCTRVFATRGKSHPPLTTKHHKTVEIIVNNHWIGYRYTTIYIIQNGYI